MNSKLDKDITCEFMLSEYEDLYQNVIHLENKLFNHLSFFTTLFIGIVTASIAIIQISGNEASSLDLTSALASLFFLFLLFLIVGRFELRMTTELRVRKMKFIEAITRIRQYFVDKNEEIEKYLILPVGVEKAPPYLRVRCKDWYQIVYISLMNGIAAMLTWTFLYFLITKIFSQSSFCNIFWIWMVLGLPIFVVVFWWLSYKSTLEFCKRYDEMRMERMEAENKYELLDSTIPKSILKWTFGDLIVWLTER